MVRAASKCVSVSTPVLPLRNHSHARFCMLFFFVCNFCPFLQLFLFVVLTATLYFDPIHSPLYLYVMRFGLLSSLALERALHLHCIHFTSSCERSFTFDCEIDLIVLVWEFLVQQRTSLPPSLRAVFSCLGLIYRKKESVDWRMIRISRRMEGEVEEALLHFLFWFWTRQMTREFEFVLTVFFLELSLLKKVLTHQVARTR